MVFDHHCEKTERTTITRAPNPTDEGWRTVRKLGSLLGDSEDVQQQKSHATAALKGYGNCGFIRTSFQKHYAFDYTMSM